MNYTCKLPVVGSECLCILNTEWSDQRVNLLLLHDNQAWNGKFQVAGDEEVAELLEELSLSEEKYLEETKIALTTHGGAANFAYSIENKKFTWKKYVGKNMTVKFGCVTILKLPVFDIFEKIIDNILESHIDMSEKLANITKEKQSFEKENLNLKIKLNDLSDKKSEMETMLYNQFLCLLNEKKKKIGELEHQLDLSDCHINDSDSHHSDNDHFGSETEIDSEEEIHTPTKVEIVKGKGSLDPDEKSTFILPKRSRQTGKYESIAGPSGFNNHLAQNSSKDVLHSEKKSIGLRVRKSQKNSFTIKTNIEDEGKSNSEEDVFMFPKRSKRTSTNMPSVSKVNYDSDETDIDKSIELDSDCDLTPSQISLVNVAEGNVSENNDHGRGNKEKKNESNNNQTSANKPNMKSEVTKNHQGYSSSVLDVLNQLM